MLVVNCPSCREKMEIEENDLHVEWECPTCESAFRVEKGDDGLLQFDITAPGQTPSNAIQPGSLVVNCPSCREMTEIDEAGSHLEWECPACAAAFRVQKGNDGSVQVNLTGDAPAPSQAIQSNAKRSKSLSRRKRKRATSEGPRGENADLDISLPAANPLEHRFPDLQPGNPPPLFTFNGMGISMYGSRDFDPATGTYVSSACLVFLFIPIFIIGAYRVADAESSGWFSGASWHVLGKVPLSPLAKGWNWTMAAVLFVLLLVCVFR